MRIVDGLATPKMPPLMKMSRSCTPWLCVIIRRRDLRSIASEVGISFGAVQSILGCMSKVKARWVPRMLTDDQIRTRLDSSRYLLSLYEDDPVDFIERVVTHDETWVHRGSYMSAHVLLNLLNELGKRDKMRGLPSILSLFRNEFNKFNNTRARM